MYQLICQTYVSTVQNSKGRFNLLQNSIHALQGTKGQIVLKAAYENNTQLPDDFLGHDLNNKPALRIEVEDTGKGMSLDEASRALEPFQYTFKWEGLGLVNVLSSVDSAGGALWFQSEQNIGTRFVFWLLTITSDDVIRTDTSMRSLDSLQVLLVEDDVEVAKVLAEMVESLGVVVQCHHDCEEVMHQINSQCLANLILRFWMSALGQSMVVEIGHHLIFEQMVDALLFISGDEPGQRIQQFDPNKVHFLRKPIGVEQVKTALVELLSTV